MEFPYRFSITTFNIWGKQHWPDRSESVYKLFNTLKSDIYTLQEVTPEIIQYLDSKLLSYKRVNEPNMSAGWLNESNIYWNHNYFELVDYGQCSLECIDYPQRCLFWIRLAFKANPQMTIFCSTAHFPWVGCNEEMITGMNQRIPATMKVCEYMRKLVPLGECIIFAGDLNEDYHPLRILSEEVGLIDVFESLDLSPPITHPVRPSDPMEEIRPNRTLDWILCNLPANMRVIGAFAKCVRGGSYGQCLPPSDHLPVIAIFEIKPTSTSHEELPSL